MERQLADLERDLLITRLKRVNPALAHTVELADERAEADKDGGGDPKVLYLYGHINSWDWDYGASLHRLREFLDEHAPSREAVLLRINSYGGLASAGVAMMNLIRDYPGRVTAQVDGVCASAATLPFLAADERLMGQGTELMIHNPSTLVGGDWEDMEKAAGYLKKLTRMYAKVYADCCDLSESEAAAAMRDETYYMADEAVEAGLATGIAESPAPVDSDEDEDSDDDSDDTEIVVVTAEKDPHGIMPADEEIIREHELNRFRRTLYGD